jgi:hypothetical protein
MTPTNDRKAAIRGMILSMSQRDAINYIKEKLSTNSQWAMQGCVRVFQFQTMEEVSKEATVDNNGVGFSGVDAKILSTLAKRVQSFWNDQRAGKPLLYATPLGPKGIALLHRKMPKYARQLYKIVVNGQ